MRCAGPSSTPRALKTRPDLVGLSGQSSGGHLAMLVAMRPHDPRYAAIPLPAGSPAHDASVRCVVMSWPVINPLSRYRHAKRARGGRQSAGMAEVDHRAPGFLLAVGSQHGGGQPDARARARREGADAAGDLVPGPRRHPARLQGRGVRRFAGNEPQRFVANYRKAGGEIALEYFDMERQPGHSPDLSKTGDMFERMVAFIGKHVSV